MDPVHGEVGNITSPNVLLITITTLNLLPLLRYTVSILYMPGTWRLQHGELKIKLELEGNNISSHVISAKYDNFSASHSGGSWKCLLQCY